MAASIGIRPLLLKTLYLPRSCCVLCIRRQNMTSSNVSQSSDELPISQPGRESRGTIPRGQINIPKRKKRDSLSILKALASTVGKDPTAPNYAMMDDPALIPKSRGGQRIALLSKASGKRTARFIVNEFKNTFDHDDAMPHVQAFQPDVVEYEHTDVSVDALTERIDRREVDHAVEVYNRMTGEGMEVPAEIKLSFLELLCVFSCKSPDKPLLPEEMVIDKLQSSDDIKSDKLSMVLADDIFETLPEKTVDTYNWIVRGLLKVGDSKGLLYYKEMTDSNLQVYLGTYNELINSVSQHKENRWTDIVTYLRAMKTNKVTPNLETFHSVLRALEGEAVRKRVPEVLAEMKAIGIEPTLHTWALVLAALQTGSSETTQRTNAEHWIMADIVEIIDHIRGNIEAVYTDHARENFLVNAMAVCRSFRDSETAMMLYELKSDLGYRYTVTSLDGEFTFYESLLILLSRNDTPDVVMNMYTKICPSEHFASKGCMLSILQNLVMYGEYQHVVQLWQDANISLQTKFVDDRTLTRFLEVFADEQIPKKIGEDFARIAKTLHDDRMEERSTADLNDGQLFGTLITIFLNNNQLENAWMAWMSYRTKSDEGYIRYHILLRLLELCIKEQDVHKIMSFCDQTMQRSMIQEGSKVIESNIKLLEEFLDQSQIEHVYNSFMED